MEGLPDSSREFISLLFHSSSQTSHQAEPLTSAPAGTEKETQITSVHPKPSLKRPGSQNNAVFGRERDHRLSWVFIFWVAHTSKAPGSIKGAVLQQRHFQRVLSAPDTQSRGEQAPWAQILCVPYTFTKKFHKQAKEKLQNHQLLDICCTKGSKLHPNTLATSHSI